MASVVFLRGVNVGGHKACRFALGVWRRTPGTFIYPNEVVEKQFRTPATTRSWNTIDAICDILRG
jgi:uncharacterized protein (DUF1697 family)